MVFVLPNSGTLIEQTIEDQVMAPLPLEFSYKLDESFHAGGKVNNHARTRLIKQILMGLSEKDKKALQESCFGPIVQLGDNLEFSSQFVHYMLHREVITKKRKEMWFCIQNYMLRFSIVEFRHVTGLNCAKIQRYQGKDVDMVQAVGKERCTLRELEVLYEEEPEESNYKLKMALLLILEGILMARDRTNTVRQLSINLVHDLDSFNAYPWGRLVYQETLDWLQKGVTKGNKAYNLYCFPLAFQIWAFEALPDLARIFARVDNPQATPLCLKWVSIKSGKRMPSYAEIKEIACKPLATFNTVLGDLDEELGWNDEEEGEDDRIVEFLRRGCPEISLVLVDNNTQVQSETIANGIDEATETTRERRELDTESSDSGVEPKRRRISSKGKRKARVIKNNNTTYERKKRKNNHEENSVRSSRYGGGQRATGGGVAPMQRAVDVESIVSSLLQKSRETEPLWAKRIREQMEELQSMQGSLIKATDRIQEAQKELLERVGRFVKKQDEDVDLILCTQRNILVTCENMEHQVSVASKRLDLLSNALAVTF